MMLKIEYIPISDIKEYEHNARKHEEKDVNAIISSIKEFGFNDPIGIWKNVVVEGHGRLQAAKKLGMDKIPCIRLDHLTEEQRRAYALAHNRTAEMSEWDRAILDIELMNIPEINMEQFGFMAEKTQQIEAGKELDIEDFDEDKYNKVCPECGFRFNV